MTHVTLEKELFLETSNQPGVASQLTTLFAEQANCNIKAMWGGSFGNQGRFAFIPDNLSKAKDVLSTSEFKNFREGEVVVAFVPDQCGSANQITSKLSQANINIEWLFTTIFDGKPAVVLCSDDNKQAVQLIQQ